MKVFLDKVTMNNCQSMVDVTMEFKPGINIIDGNNSYGKSIFMKILRVVLFPDDYSSPNRNDIIRYGKEFAMVQYFFSDGMDCIVKIYRNKSLYMLRDPKISRDYIVDEVPFARLKRALSVVVDEQERFVANCFNAGQDLFLVDSDSRTNERLLRASCYNEELDTLKNLVTENASKYRDMESELRSILYSYILNMGDQTYKDTTDIERLLDLSEHLLQALEHFLDLDEFIGSMIPFESIGGLSTEDCLSLITVLEIDQLLTGTTDVWDMDDDTFSLALKVLGISENINNLEDFDTAQESVLIFLYSILGISADVDSLESDYSVLYGGLEELLSICGDLAGYTEVEDLDFAIVANDARVLLMEMNNLLSSYTHSLSVVESSSEDIESLRKEMQEFNGLIECKIHGEVFFVDGQCIPADNGLT